jgi:hypothetical protein
VLQRHLKETTLGLIHNAVHADTTDASVRPGSLI